MALGHSTSFKVLPTHRHVKTVIILAGGVLLFGDEMPPKKLAGISLALSGIIW